VERVLARIPQTEEEDHSPIVGDQSISKAEAEQLRRLDLRPRVALSEGGARSSFVLFSPWGGFIRRTTSVHWPDQRPHNPGPMLRNQGDETIVPYDCGIIY